jgi:PadR family transcriptional regulator PadR
MKQKSEVLQGTLDLLVLKTLDTMGPMHGYGISQRIQQVSEDVLQLNQGTLYPALLRLEQRGWVQSNWGVSDNNRKARYYSVTRSGRKQLVEERANWDRVSGAIESRTRLELTRCASDGPAHVWQQRRPVDVIKSADKNNDNPTPFPQHRSEREYSAHPS